MVSDACKIKIILTQFNTVWNQQNAFTFGFLIYVPWIKVKKCGEKVMLLFSHVQFTYILEYNYFHLKYSI